METLRDFLWPIVLVGGLGAFVDFLIGKAGQERAKDFLLEWWVRFDDVHWKNFGREEGLFAGRLTERWFGKSIWSRRRFAAALIFLLLFGFADYAGESYVDKFSSLSDSYKNALLPEWNIYHVYATIGKTLFIIIFTPMLFTYVAEALCTRIRWLYMLLRVWASFAKRPCGSAPGREAGRCGRRCRGEYRRLRAVCGAD